MEKRINTAFGNDLTTLAAQFLIGTSVGSGIYVHHGTNIYFCTARHVVFRESKVKNKLSFSALANQARVKSYSIDSKFQVHDELELDIQKLFETGKISTSPNIDLCIITVANVVKGKLKLIPGISCISKNLNLNVASSSMVKSAKKIEAGEEAYVIGYPKALAQFRPDKPLYNYELPLVRKGIISSMNDYKTFVVDCAVYGGNSGGPVFVAENIISIKDDKVEVKTFRHLVGIVSKYVPLLNMTASTKSNITGSHSVTPHLENSGYGICISFDIIEKELKKIAAKKANA